MPPVAVSVINAVLHPRLAAPRGSLGVACNVTGATELIPKPKGVERVSNSPGEGFSPPRLSLRRPGQHDSGDAQITKSGGEGGPRGPPPKHANVINLFHHSDISIALAIYTPTDWRRLRSSRAAARRRALWANRRRADLYWHYGIDANSIVTAAEAIAPSTDPIPTGFERNEATAWFQLTHLRALRRRHWRGILTVGPDIGRELPVPFDFLPHHDILAGDVLRRWTLNPYSLRYDVREPMLVVWPSAAARTGRLRRGYPPSNGARSASG
jgi:hypothetical protein